MKLQQPQTPAEIIGDKISRAGVVSAPELRLEAMGNVAIEHAAEETAKLRAILGGAEAELVAFGQFCKDRGTWWNLTVQDLLLSFRTEQAARLPEDKACG